MKRDDYNGFIRDGYDGLIDRDAIATRDTHGGFISSTVGLCSRRKGG